MRIARVIIAMLVLCADASAQSLKIAAAISLRDAMDAIGKAYEAESKAKIESTYGSSGQLAAQIRSGAEIDLFISAANAQVDDLAKENLVLPDTRRVIAGNTLVLVVPANAKDAPFSFEALASQAVKKLSIGEPRTVPAGQYASQVLVKLNLETTLKDKIVYGTNVRQVLTYVEQGEVSAGIVYSTDARESGDKVKVVATAPAGSHDPIVYPAVVIRSSKQPELAKKLLDYFQSEKALAILREKGFSDPLRSGKTPSP